MDTKTCIHCMDSKACIHCMDTKTCIQLQGPCLVHPLHGHEDMHPPHGHEDVHPIAGAVPCASVVWTRRRAFNCRGCALCIRCMDTKTCIQLQGLCLVPALKKCSTTLLSPACTANANYALCIKRSLGHLRTGARHSSCNRMHVDMQLEAFATKAKYAKATSDCMGGV